MRKLTLLLCLGLLTAAFLALSGCNTVEGVGKDIEATGSGLSNAADDAKPD